MAKNIADLRFVVRSPGAFVSSVWRLWVTRHGDAYLASRQLAKILKLSLHRSGICRSAFTSEHGTPASMPDRLIFKWRRKSIPSVGSGDGTRVVWLGIPTDYLSFRPDLDLTEHVCVPSAPSGGATYFEIVFTAEPQDAVELAFSTTGNRNLLLYAWLPEGHGLFICWYHADWVNEDLRMPGNGVADLIFSAADPLRTGRPVRLTMGLPPKDGDAMVITELGGYAEPGICGGKGGQATSQA
jgi:hypothetical protein